MNLLTKMLGRPISWWQVGSVMAYGLCAHIILPEDPSTLEWVAYFVSFLAVAVYGMDNYREGIETGIKIMEKM